MSWRFPRRFNGNGHAREAKSEARPLDVQAIRGEAVPELGGEAQERSDMNS
jgi:hypothetical protein